MKLEPGLTVDGRYRLIDRIGSGGMADVWRAHDSQLGRDVALKLLHENFARDKEFVERFRREASAAAGLQHPNVVSVYDRGTYEDSYYISMELVEGSSLRDLINQGLSIEEAVEVTRQVLSAAEFAHEQGIVHRDLKPLNVLIDRAGRRPGHRLRDRPRRRLGDHPHGLGDGHRPVPEPRAGAGDGGDGRRRHLLDRNHPLRDALRARSLRRGQRRGDRDEAGRRGPARPELDQPQGHPGARRGRAQGAGQGPGAALRLGRRDDGRPRRRRGRSRLRRRSGAAGRDGGRRRAPLTQVVVDRRRDRARPDRRRAGLVSDPAGDGHGSRT